LVTDQTATAPAAITINYEKIGMMVEGGRNVKDVITLQITKDASGNFLSCYSDVSNSILTAIDEAVMKACKAPGVKYNPVSKLCEVNPSLSDEMKCPSGQYLEKVQAVDVGAGEVRYVPTCRSKDMLCPAGQTGVIAPSGVVCNDNDCGAGRYLAGFDNVGNKICRDLINPSLANCVGGVGLSVDAAGRAQLTCCAADCTGATAHCAGTVFASANGCGTCSGTLAPNCSGASSICSGNSFPSTNSCGSCIGTMVSDCSAATTTCKGTVFVAANGCGTCTGTGPCENWLVNAQHKDVQCVGRGGVVVGGGPPFQFCKFSGNACPAGWTQYLSWSTTTPRIQTGVWKCNTGSHPFSNIAMESCKPPHFVVKIQYANIVEIGCY
jgi:hypothetical protein